MDLLNLGLPSLLPFGPAPTAGAGFEAIFQSVLGTAGGTAATEQATDLSAMLANAPPAADSAGDLFALLDDLDVGAMLEGLLAGLPLPAPTLAQVEAALGLAPDSADTPAAASGASADVQAILRLVQEHLARVRDAASPPVAGNGVSPGASDVTSATPAQPEPVPPALAGGTPLEVDGTPPTAAVPVPSVEPAPNGVVPSGAVPAGAIPPATVTASTVTASTVTASSDTPVSAPIPVPGGPVAVEPLLPAPSVPVIPLPTPVYSGSWPAGNGPMVVPPAPPIEPGTLPVLPTPVVLDTPSSFAPVLGGAPVLPPGSGSELMDALRLGALLLDTGTQQGDTTGGPVPLPSPHAPAPEPLPSSPGSGMAPATPTGTPTSAALPLDQLAAQSAGQHAVALPEAELVTVASDAAAHKSDPGSTGARPPAGSEAVPEIRLANDTWDTRDAAPASRNLPTRTPLTHLQDHIVRAARLSAREHGGVVHLQLEPQALGRLTVHVIQDHDVIQIELTAQSQQVREVLQGQMSHLKQQLANQGLALQDVTVSLEMGTHGQPTDRHDSPQGNGPIGTGAVHGPAAEAPPIGDAPRAPQLVSQLDLVA